MKLDGLLSGWRVRRTLGQSRRGSVRELERKDAFGGTDRCALRTISIRPRKGETEEELNRRVEALALRLRKASALRSGGDVLGYDDRWVLPRTSGTGWHIYLKMDLLEPVQEWRRYFRGGEELLRLTGKPETYEAQIRTYLERTRIRDEVIVRLGTAVCRALERQHRQGIGFCNVKPSNIFTDGAGNFLLGDPGLGELALETGGEFLPPEAAEDRMPEENWDVYSLGLTLYWLLNDSRAPFLPPAPEPVTEAQRQDARKKRLEGKPLPAPRYGGDRLRATVLQACAFRPQERFKTPEAFRKALEQVLTPAEASKPREEARNRKETAETPKPGNWFSVEADLDGSGGRLWSRPKKWGALPQMPGEARHISAGGHHTVALRKNGTAVAVGENEAGQCKVHSWSQLRAVSAGFSHTLGLQTGCTVVATGENKDGQCDVWEWKDVVQISAGYNHSVARRRDKTVVATGSDQYGQCQVSDWTNITAVSAGSRHTVGLKADGTVVAVGDNGSGQCEVGGWKDIVQISAGMLHTVGLRSDGTAVAVGHTQGGRCDVGKWRDLIAVSAGASYTIGLKKNGDVVSVGFNNGGWCDVGAWKNVVEISAGVIHTAAICTDGTALSTGVDIDGQCRVYGWSELKTKESFPAIKYKAACAEHGGSGWEKPGKAGMPDFWQVSAGTGHILAVRTDGAVLAAGDPVYGTVRAQKWKNVIMVAAGNCHCAGLRTDGTVIAAGSNFDGCCYVAGWSGITAIAAGRDFTVGLRADGRVISTCYSGGLAELKSWSDMRAIAAADRHAIGLRRDGTVAVAGCGNGAGRVSEWSNIVAVCGGVAHTVGLRRDGTVAWAGEDEISGSQVAGWRDITAIAAGSGHTVALRADGTVLACGAGGNGQCEVSGWRDVMAIACGDDFTLGLRRNGTILLAGNVPEALRAATCWKNLRVNKSMG